MAVGHYLNTQEELEHFNSLIGQAWLQGKRSIRVEFVDDGPTPAQFSALHVWCGLVAIQLNDAGFSVMQVLKHDAEIPWTKELAKEHLWRPIQKAMTGKRSSKDTGKLEYPEISETLSRHLAQTLGITPPPWPVKDRL